MTYDYPSYYGNFHCVGGSCKDSCCIGWEVDIDEDTYEYYWSLEGPFGDRLRAHMKDDGTDRYFPMRKDGRCPFLNRSNLCDIIIELSQESLSQVCTEYPRYFLEEGSFEQIDLSLSCMELGRIFFSDPDPIEYIREEMPDPDDYPLQGINIEENELLQSILDIRDDCIGIMEDRDMSLKDRFREVLLRYGPREWKEKLEAAGEKDAGRSDAGEEYRGLSNTSLADKKTKGTDLADLARLFGIVIDLQELMNIMDGLEVLDGRWTEEMTEIRSYLPAIPRLTGQSACGFHGTAAAGAELPSSEQAACGENGFPGATSQVWFEKLGCYFLFRYVTDAYFSERPDKPEKAERAEDPASPGSLSASEGSSAPWNMSAPVSHPGVAASVRFCARAIYFIYIMCLSRYLKNGRRFCLDDMIDLAHLYSKQVEHSDENVDRLKS